MMFRRCMFSISSLVALAVICDHQEKQVVGSQPPKMNTSEPEFLVKPYLQLGNVTWERVGRDLALLWHAADVTATWVVEYKATTGVAWALTPRPSSRRIAMPGTALIGFFRLSWQMLFRGQNFVIGYAAMKRLFFPQSPVRRDSLTNRIGLYRLGTVERELPSKSRSRIRLSLPSRISL